MQSRGRSAGLLYVGLNDMWLHWVSKHFPVCSLQCLYSNMLRVWWKCILLEISYRFPLSKIVENWLRLDKTIEPITMWKVFWNTVPALLQFIDKEPQTGCWYVQQFLHSAGARQTNRLIDTPGTGTFVAVVRISYERSDQKSGLKSRPTLKWAKDSLLLLAVAYSWRRLANCHTTFREFDDRCRIANISISAVSACYCATDNKDKINVNGQSHCWCIAPHLRSAQAALGLWHEL